jgi:hypothetical protein
VELGSILPVAVTAITAVATAWSAAFLTGWLSPNIELRITTNWIDESILALILEVENCGNIRCGIEKVLLATRMIEIEGDIAGQFALVSNEWISFEDSERIMASSYYINPKEVIHVERLYRFPGDDILHAGLQIYLRYPNYIRLLGAQARSTRQTRVYYISRNKKQGPVKR